MATLVTGATLRTSGANAQPLFDGKSLQGWTTIEGQPVTQGWEVVDGMIHLKAAHERAGHILSACEYGDFDFRFEWKIAAGGNSGIKYRVRFYEGYPRGCEYQIIDDLKYREPLAPKNSAGALYDLCEPGPQKALRPAGEFNSARIVVRANHIEHWLNDQLIVTAAVGSDDWTRRVAASKFAELPQFAENQRGRIMLTDHGAEVWFRNIRFEELGPARPRE